MGLAVSVTIFVLDQNWVIEVVYNHSADVRFFHWHVNGVLLSEAPLMSVFTWYCSNFGFPGFGTVYFRQILRFGGTCYLNFRVEKLGPNLVLEGSVCIYIFDENIQLHCNHLVRIAGLCELWKWFGQLEICCITLHLAFCLLIKLKFCDLECIISLCSSFQLILQELEQTL